MDKEPQSPGTPKGVSSGGDEEDAPKPQPYVDVTYWDIAKEFSLLGYIGFGGPAAHIGLFQKVAAATHHASRMHACMHAGARAGAC